MQLNQHLKLNVCDCGDLHLTYRSVTMHFEKNEFLSYAALVGQMAARISDSARLRQTRTIPDTRNRTCH
jgi:hypothetical protein